MPSFNEHTGARISSGSHVKGTDKEKFDAGWNLIFGKPQATPEVNHPHMNIQSFTDCCLDCGENVNQVEYCNAPKRIF